MASHLMRGLDYLHSNGLVHSDVCLRNLLWTKEGEQLRYKLTDLGLCCSSVSATSYAVVVAFHFCLWLICSLQWNNHFPSTAPEARQVVEAKDEKKSGPSMTYSPHFDVWFACFNCVLACSVVSFVCAGRPVFCSLKSSPATTLEMRFQRSHPMAPLSKCALSFSGSCWTKSRVCALSQSRSIRISFL